MRLSDDRLHEVHAAAIKLGLASEQDSLLAGLPPEFVGTLPTEGSHAARLLSTLQALNWTSALRDGTVPLHVWLRAARLLRSAYTESRVFDEALAELQHGGLPNA